MKSKKLLSLLALALGWLSLSLQMGCLQSLAQEEKPTAETATPAQPDIKRQDIPMYFPHSLNRGESTNVPFPPEELTIVPEIQEQLDSFIQDHGSPIAAVVVMDVRTGSILAMAQGRDPKEWGGTTHSALHTGFPTASLFKTVVAAAGIEVAGIDPSAPIGLNGRCGDVNPRGVWLRQTSDGRIRDMTLRRAYGHSCNGFFAKIAVNQIGLGNILDFAKRFGWNGQPIMADFNIPVSPFKQPNAAASSVHTVGKFAAGFGQVGTSAVHIAWQTTAIANNGQMKPARLFKNSQLPEFSGAMIAPETAREIRQMMDATVMGGTSSFAFRNGKYRRIRHIVGGKTGTLTGQTPHGLTTWFTGLMPLENPEVAVAAVVVLEDLWRFKASNLAAEAFSVYADHSKISQTLTSTPKHRSSRL